MKRINPSSDLNFGSFSTSKKELTDLAKAWAAISFAFANLLASQFFNINFFITLLVSAGTVGLGFILHELGHKILAQKYGCSAEFRSWDNMLFLAIILSFFGFVLAAPGAVMISGPVGKRRNGKISAAGPTINIILGALFMAMLLRFNTGIMAQIGRVGSQVNIWLGLFNLIPFMNLDGKKIWNWNKAYYIGLAIVGISLLFISFS